MKRIMTCLTMIAVLSLGLMTVAHAATAKSAAAPKNVCAEVVQSMKNEWRVVDFPTASKPSAVRVQGKYGHENSAAQISYMQNQIKQADADCKAGNQQSALQRVSSIHDLLDAHGISQETANAAMAPR